jgi:hypothetical protein
MQEGRAPQGATELFAMIEFLSPLQGSALVQLPPGVRKKRSPLAIFSQPLRGLDLGFFLTTGAAAVCLRKTEEKKHARDTDGAGN